MKGPDRGTAAPADRDRGRFPGLKAPRGPAFDTANVDPPAWLAAQRAALTPEQIAHLDKQYERRAEAVPAVDRMIGRLETTLKRRGVWRNTYLVFSSDNGFHLGQHRLLGGKQTASTHDIRVPLRPGVRPGRPPPAAARRGGPAARRGSRAPPRPARTPPRS